MCGIAGFISKEPTLELKQLQAMGHALRHRGPDDSGANLWDTTGQQITGGAGCVGLAHQRLSILDLSSAGHQPMCNASGDIWIVYNGECYNFADFIPELKSKGYQFLSQTDTEVIIHLYEEYGLEETLKRLNGMFAFALWDKRVNKLVLARDRMGKKPLFYSLDPLGRLLFGSEIKALTGTGCIDQDRLDPVALHQFWMYGYPHGDRTVYQQIRKLPPASFAVWEGGSLKVNTYWDCPFDPDPRPRDLDDLTDEFEALLLDATRLRLIADVPVGLFLSGGIDSSLVCAMAAKTAGKEISTFTIAFDEQMYNEAPYAVAISAHLGLPNKVLTVSDDLRSNFDTIADQFDEPFGDSSSIPTYYLCRMVREHVTVALSGDGGDEVFAGYNAYAKGLWLWGNMKQKRLFGKRIPWQNWLVESPMMLIPKEDRLLALEKFMSDRTRAQIFSEKGMASATEADIYRERRHWIAQGARTDLVSQMQYLNIKTYLPEDILMKVDRMSMVHSLECRCPLLDYRIAEFAAGLPYDAKIDAQGRQKVLMRRLLDRHMPTELYDRPKAGFCVPWTDWCQGEMGAVHRKHWADMKSPYFRPEAAEVLFPRKKPGWRSLQWNAFVTHQFVQNQQQGGVS
jgi:asparagine synthase (glutamine-hydrolysing)